MKIFDCHIHAGGTQPDPALIMDRMDESGIYGGCIFSTRPERYNGNIGLRMDDRIQELNLWTKGHEDRLIPILWIHPYEAKVVDAIRSAKNLGIRGFKIICNDFYIYEPVSLKIIEEIAATGLPVFFHTGILYSEPSGYALCSSQYNRPLNWEAMLNVPDLRFSMGHCSWPWVDECVALWGEFVTLKDYGCTSASMFLDATPGAHSFYRDDLFKKIYTYGWNMGKDIMFGLDNSASNYSVAAAKAIIAQDTAILDGLGVTEAQKEQYFGGNLMRFLGI